MSDLLLREKELAVRAAVDIQAFSKNEQSSSDRDVIRWIEDEGIDRVVEKLSGMEFSSMSRIRDRLKEKLIDLIHNQNAGRTDEDELDFEDLEQVAAGLHRNMDDIKEPKLKIKGERIYYE